MGNPALFSAGQVSMHSAAHGTAYSRLFLYTGPSHVSHLKGIAPKDLKVLENKAAFDEKKTTHDLIPTIKLSLCHRYGDLSKLLQRQWFGPVWGQISQKVV